MTGPVTKLRAGDEDFLVASMIERCLQSMMLRELVQNALEAALNAPNGNACAVIGRVAAEGVRKLRICNTGAG
jgi:hypothetical protein